MELSISRTMQSKRLIIVVGNKGNLANQLAYSNITNTPLLKTNKPSEIRKALDFADEADIIYTSFYKTKEPGRPEQVSEYTKQALGLLSDVICAVIQNKGKINSFIYCSSAAVYGNAEETLESSPIYPTSLYGQMKLTCERLVIEMMNKEIPTIIVARIFNTFGGQDESSVVSRIVGAFQNQTQLCIANNGDAVRDFIHVKDVARILMDLMRVDNFTGIVNVGSGRGVLVKDLVKRVEVNSRRKLDIRYYNQTEVSKSVADTDRLSMLCDISHMTSVIDYLDLLSQLKPRI